MLIRPRLRRWQVAGMTLGLSGLLVAGLLGPGAQSAAAANTFTDDDGNVHESNIEALVAARVTGGCNTEGTRYCPDNDVNRGQMATFLVRSLHAVGLPVPPQAPDAFSDDDGTPHESNINKLASMGIATGNSSGNFNPFGNVIRGQMALFLQRAFDLPAGEPTSFTDVPEIYRQAVEAVRSAGITSGCTRDGTRYCPEANSHRDQMATFLVNAMRYAGQDLDQTWEWGAPETGEPSEDEATPGGAEPPSDSTAAGDRPVESSSETTSREADDEGPDPCALVTTDEWRAIVGATPDEPELLEGGEACGYRNLSDTRRLAVAELPTMSEQRYLTAEDTAMAEAVEGLGDAAFWLPNWPLEQSSTLVVQQADIDLVLELTSRRDPADDHHKQAAISLAQTALGRIS